MRKTAQTTHVDLAPWNFGSCIFQVSRKSVKGFLSCGGRLPSPIDLAYGLFNTCTIIEAVINSEYVLLCEMLECYRWAILNACHKERHKNLSRTTKLTT